MPRSRNARIAAWLNNSDWPEHYDGALVDALQHRTLMLRDLSSSDLFEIVLQEVREEMVRRIGHNFQLDTVKVRVNVIRRRFYEFMAFTCLPGVKFDRRSNHLQFTTRYNGGSHGETQAEREFRRYGFPYYMVCAEVFERKNAAAVNFDNPGVERNNGVNAPQGEQNGEGGNEADDELDGAMENMYGWGSGGYSSEASQNTWSR